MRETKICVLKSVEERNSWQNSMNECSSTASVVLHKGVIPQKHISIVNCPPKTHYKRPRGQRACLENCWRYGIQCIALRKDGQVTKSWWPAMGVEFDYWYFLLLSEAVPFSPLIIFVLPKTNITYIVPFKLHECQSFGFFNFHFPIFIIWDNGT